MKPRVLGDEVGLNRLCNGVPDHAMAWVQYQYRMTILCALFHTFNVYTYSAIITLVAYIFVARKFRMPMYNI